MEQPNYNPQVPGDGGIDFTNQQLQQRNMDLASALSSQAFGNEEEQNLIHYQLETDKILERIEHFLKGDQIKFNDKGQYFASPTKTVLCNVKRDSKTGMQYYFYQYKEKGSEITTEVLVKIENKDGVETMLVKADSLLISSKLKRVTLIDEGYRYTEIDDEDKKPLNEYGVAELMRIMSMYITKETFLSRYEEERINEIMGDLGDSLNNFLYCNYEKMGMDTKFKESKYTLLILNLLHTVESCYRRALGGAEQENLRTRAIVTQNQGIGQMGMPGNIHVKKRWNPLKPNTW
jgi:hypothetical protein